MRTYREEGDVERKDVAPNKWQLPALTSNGTLVVYNQSHSGLCRSASEVQNFPFLSLLALSPLMPSSSGFSRTSVHWEASTAACCQVIVEGPGEHRVLGHTLDRWFSISPSLSLFLYLILSLWLLSFVPLSARRSGFADTRRNLTRSPPILRVASQTRQRAVPLVVLPSVICREIMV